MRIIGDLAHASRPVLLGLVLLRVSSRYTRYTRRIEISAYIPAIRIRRSAQRSTINNVCPSVPHED